MFTRIRNGVLALLTIAWASLDPGLRGLMPEIRAFLRAMPARYDAQPLPDFLSEITPTSPDLSGIDPEPLHHLLDSMARIDRNHPFGLCLRRSLVRYHFLRRAGLPLGIVFGVRFRPESETGGVAGHAWTTLDAQPFHENARDYEGFREIYRWPGD
ncbi:MAG: lasso peptide biosynthesis B2 protein [Caldilineales bacterium]|nr:lasso peptide biosynthesis B2 protein [Caldilineales bacterium]